MSRIDLEIRLNSDLVMNARSGTLGAPRGLDFIPGRALWGAAGARLYESSALAPDELFQVFQAGAVRFSDAVPSVEGRRARPTPRTWHVTKHAAKGADLVFDTLTERPREQLTPFQPERWRHAENEQALEWDARVALRTAITTDGRARDGFFFAYEALPAGLVFHAFLEGPDAWTEAVARALEAPGVRLGRSRGAEYGEVEIRRIAARPGDLPPGTGARGSVAFLAASRVALRDPGTGAVSFAPEPADFGLTSDWVFDPEQSVLRTERFTPFHGTRRRRDLERQVISRGSVIVFKNPSGAAADLGALRAAIARGVGELRNEGLGEVLAEPSWLRRPQFKRPSEPIRLPKALPAPCPTDELFAWVTSSADERKRFDAVAKRVDARLQDARRLPVSAAQWGYVRSLARNHRLAGDHDLTQLLQSKLDRGAAGARTWSRRVRGDKTVLDTLLGWLGEVEGEKQAAWLELLAADTVSRSAVGDR